MKNKFHIHKKNFDKLFSPKSIAIVGTNNVAGTVPHDIMSRILTGGFKGDVFPVSPGEKKILDISTYKYVIDIEKPVDLAILVFPSSVCHMALEQCGQKGIKAVVIISAGFKETGEKGLEREKKLVEIADKYEMSFIGPNCLGIINAEDNVLLNASFARKMPEPGNIGFLSQSGALCTAVLDYALAKHIGFSKFVSFGNKADISEIDFLYYLMDDEKTKVILLYLEEVSDGPGLMKAAKDVIKKSGKPILIIKSGRTFAGASAAVSHTGSLAGSDEICDEAFRQAGIIRCDNIEEMFNIAIAFAYQPLPKSNKVAIVTNAGGPGVLTTDATINKGLELAEFSEETTSALKKHLPATANIKNPVDVIGDAHADRYSIAMSSIIKDPDVNALFVILTPQSMTDIDEIAKEVVSVSKQSNKPIYASFMGESDVAIGIKILQKNKIPHYILPESMSSTFSRVFEFTNILQREENDINIFEDVNKEEALKILNTAIQEKREYLPENESSRVLKAYGLPVSGGRITNTPKEAVQIANEIGYPVVMKIMSDDIVHKFDVKGVLLNLKSEEEVRNGYHSISLNVSKLQPNAKINGIYVTKFIPKGEEVILGIKNDPSFGPVIMFGLGGIYVEVFKDISFRVTPIDNKTADSMIMQIKSSKILTGIRGRKPADIESIKECIMRLSQLAQDCPQIKELDINPLIVLEEGKGCYVADAKIML